MDLKVEKRTAFGKEVRKLRRGGLIPANVYGQGAESIPIQVSTVDLRLTLRATGRHGLVDMTVGDGRRPQRIKALVREVHRDPVTKALLHVDFQRVLLTETLQVDVNVVAVGEAPAVQKGTGTLMHNVNSIRVEGLPDHLPSVLEADISALEEPHDAVRVKEVRLPEGVRLVTDPDLPVFTIAPAKIGAEEIERAEEAAAAAKAEEAPAAEEQQAKQS